MNNIDKEIDEFKSNLVLIDKISKDIKDNNSNLTKMLEDCKNLEEIKRGLDEEINNINKTNKEYTTTLKSLCDKIATKNEEILKRINTQNQEIKNLKEQVNNLTKNNGIYLKIIIGLLIIIVVLCVVFR